jgi:two-component system sensor histidine kinase DesK
VADDGTRLHAGAEVRAGNGLAGMRERAASVGGRLRLSVEAGLRLELCVPAGGEA